MRSVRVDWVHHFEHVAVRRDSFYVRVSVILERDADVEIAVVVAVQLSDLKYREAVQWLHEFHCLVAVHRWPYQLPRLQLHRLREADETFVGRDT